MATGWSGKVIVIEDDDSMREAIAILLDAAAMGSVLFPSAEALLAHACADGAACIVSDLKLPGMSGLDLLAELRSRGGWPPLILITAHDCASVRAEALRQGTAGYLAKPFLGSELLAAIRRAGQQGNEGRP